MSFDAWPMRRVTSFDLWGGGPRQCSAPAPRAHTRTGDKSRPPASAASRCGGRRLWICDAIGDGPPPEDLVLVLGNVALPYQRGAPWLETSRDSRPGQHIWTIYSNAGLGFRTGIQWQLKVPKYVRDPLRTWLRSLSGTPAAVVRPPAGCPISSMASKTGWLMVPWRVLLRRARVLSSGGRGQSPEAARAHRRGSTVPRA